MFECERALEILLSRQPWSWVREKFVLGCGLQAAANKYRAERILVPVPPTFMSTILRLTGKFIPGFVCPFSEGGGIWFFVILQCPASVRASTISLNNISSETTYWILTKLHRNDPWVVPYQSCSNRSSWLHK